MREPESFRERVFRQRERCTEYSQQEVAQGLDLGFGRTRLSPLVACRVFLLAFEDHRLRIGQAFEFAVGLFSVELISVELFSVEIDLPMLAQRIDFANRQIENVRLCLKSVALN
jgi:hypothetical protein